MSALEDLAKKYVDELSSFLPLPCILSFSIGVALIGFPEHQGSLWINLLSSKFQSYWFFRDILTNLVIWKLAAIAVLSITGSYFSRVVSKRFISVGTRAAGDSLRIIYRRAVAVSDKGDFSKIEIDAARQWRVMRFGAVWGYFKAASFCFSIAGISALSFALSRDMLDLFFILAATAVGLYLSFVFSKRYFVAYLPERILFDASLGLIDPRIVEDL